MSITSERLSALMSSQGIGTRELAFQVGVPIHAVECYLNGSVQPGEQVLPRLAVALHTTVDYLLGVPFHKVIWERISNPNAENYPDPWWDAEIKQFTKNIQASMEFIRSECTDEEFLWLSEVFDDMIEQTQSRMFFDCLQERAQQVKNPEWKEEILKVLHLAAEFVGLDNNMETR